MPRVSWRLKFSFKLCIFYREANSATRFIVFLFELEVERVYFRQWNLRANVSCVQPPRTDVSQNERHQAIERNHNIEEFTIVLTHSTFSSWISWRMILFILEWRPGMPWAREGGGHSQYLCLCVLRGWFVSSLLIISRFWGERGRLRWLTDSWWKEKGRRCPQFSCWSTWLEGAILMRRISCGHL